MAWIAPPTRSAGALITAAIWNQDIVANPVALHTGEIAMSNQVNGHFVVASSASQLAVQKNSYVKIFYEVYN